MKKKNWGEGGGILDEALIGKAEIENRKSEIGGILKIKKAKKIRFVSFWSEVTLSWFDI